MYVAIQAAYFYTYCKAPGAGSVFVYAMGIMYNFQQRFMDPRVYIQYLNELNQIMKCTVVAMDQVGKIILSFKEENTVTNCILFVLKFLTVLPISMTHLKKAVLEKPVYLQC